MNFKAQAKQNQMLKCISTQHLVVGIDIAQQSHVAHAVNFREISLGTPLHFSNNDDETFKRQHEVNVKTKSMKLLRSVMKLCGKLARILVAIARSGEAYEPNRVLPMKQVVKSLHAPHKNWLIRRISRLHEVPDCFKPKGIDPYR